MLRWVYDVDMSLEMEITKIKWFFVRCTEGNSMSGCVRT